MLQPGNRLRGVETREGVSQIEVSADPNTLNGGAGVVAAAGTLAIDPSNLLMYYNTNGTPTGWDVFDAGGGGSGESNIGANVGDVAGAEVYKDKTGVTLNFRRLRNKTVVTAAVNGDNIDLDFDLTQYPLEASAASADELMFRKAAGGTYFRFQLTELLKLGGDITGGTSLGTGADVYKTKSGADLQFRSILATLPVAVAENTDDLTFSFTMTGVSSLGLPVVGTDTMLFQRGAGAPTVATVADLPFTGVADGVTDGQNIGSGKPLFKTKVGTALHFRTVGGPAPIVVVDTIDDLTISFNLDGVAAIGLPVVSTDRMYIQRTAVITPTMVTVANLPFVTDGLQLGSGFNVYKENLASVLQFRAITFEANGPFGGSSDATEIELKFDIGQAPDGAPTSVDQIIYKDFGDGLHYRTDFGDVAGILPFVGNNLGSGVGVYKNKTGSTLHFKSLLVAASGTPLAYSSLTDEVLLAFDLENLVLATDIVVADMILIKDDGTDIHHYGTVSQLPFTLATDGVTDGQNIGSGKPLFKTKVGTALHFRTVGGTAPIVSLDTIDDLTISFTLDGVAAIGLPVVGTDRVYVQRVGTAISTMATVADLPFVADGDGVTDGQNVGTSPAAVFKTKSGTTLQFRSLGGTEPIVVTETTDDITFSFWLSGVSTIGLPVVTTDTVLLQRGTDFSTVATVGDLPFTLATDGITDGANVGTGVAAAFKVKSGTALHFRSFSASNGISVVQTTDDVSWTLTMNGMTAHGLPVIGTDKIILQVGGAYPVVATVADLPFGDGDITGASNLGSGEGIFASESSGVLEFKSLTEGMAIVLTGIATEISVEFDINRATVGTVATDDLFIFYDTDGLTHRKGTISDLPFGAGDITSGANVGSGWAVYKDKLGSALRFRTLQATNLPVQVTQGTDDLYFKFTMTGVTAIETPVVGTDLLIMQRGTSNVTTATVADLPFAAGDVTDGANVGGGTATIFKTKSGTELQFKTINYTVPAGVTEGTDTITFVFTMNGVATITLPVQTTDTMVLQRGGSATTVATVGDLPFGTGDGDITDGANVGTGSYNVFKIKSGTELHFRTLETSAPIGAVQTTDEITLTFSLDTVSNIGLPVVGTDRILLQRTEETSPAIATVGDLPFGTGDGDITGGSNTGAGANIFRDELSTVLRFRSLINEADSPVSFEQGTDSVTVMWNINDMAQKATPVAVDRIALSEPVGDAFYYTEIGDLPFGQGDITDGQNVGSGKPIFKTKVGTALHFRTVGGTAPIVSVDTIDDLTISFDLAGVATIGLPVVDTDRIYIQRTATNAPTIATIADLPFGVGDITGASNLGSGDGVFVSESGGVLEFKSLTQGIAIVLTGSATEIDVDFDINRVTDGTVDTEDVFIFYDTSDGSHRKGLISDLPFGTGDGDITSGANVGSGWAVYKDELAGVLRFRTLQATNLPVEVTQGTDDVYFKFTMTGVTSIVTPVLGTDLLILQRGTSNVTAATVGDLPFGTGDGTITGGASVGGQAAVYKGEVANVLQFRSLTYESSSPISLDEGTDVITVVWNINDMDQKLVPVAVDRIALSEPVGDAFYYTEIGDLPFGQGDVTDGSNVGTGSYDVFKIKSGTELDFRTLETTSPVEATQTTDEITITFSLDTVVAIGLPVVGTDRILLQRTEVVSPAVATVADLPFAAGDVTDGQNVGSGKPVFKTKVGTALHFRTVGGTAPIVSVDTTDDLTISFNLDGVATIGLPVVDTDRMYIQRASTTTPTMVTIADLPLGDISSGANVGSGVAVYKEAAAGVLKFRTLQATLPAKVLQGTDDLYFSFTMTGVTGIATPVVGTDLLILQRGTSAVTTATVADLPFGEGTVLGGNSLGTGSPVYSSALNDVMQFRSIDEKSAASGLTVSHTTTEVELDVNIIGMTLSDTYSTDTHFLTSKTGSPGTKRKTTWQGIRKTLGVSWTRTTDFSLAHNAVTTITWQNELRDTIGISPGANLTIGIAGVYQINVMVGMTGLSTENVAMQILIYRNGVEVGRTRLPAIQSTGVSRMQICHAISFAATQYLTVKINQTNGSSTTVTVTEAYVTADLVGTIA